MLKAQMLNEPHLSPTQQRAMRQQIYISSLPKMAFCYLLLCVGRMVLPLHCACLD